MVNWIGEKVVILCSTGDPKTTKDTIMKGKDTDSNGDGKESILTRFWNSWKSDTNNHLDFLLGRRRLDSSDFDAFLKRRLPFFVLVSLLLICASWIATAIRQ
jgi:hypothetical protein